MRLLVTIFALISFCLAANCPSTHPFVGFVGELASHADGVQGTVTILDDCTFTVTGFATTGAPAVYFHGATGLSRSELLAGFRLSNMRVAGVYNGNGAFTIDISQEGKTWNDVKAISVWCEDFAANLGDIILAIPTAPSINNSTGYPLNCIPLKDGVYNFHWQLQSNNSVKISLEAVLPSTASWMGFGFSNPLLNATQMVGSDVTVAGFFQAQPFSIDYFISAKSQCDYSATHSNGVCPDASNDVQLVSGIYYQGVTKITFIKTLVSNDIQQDIPIDINAQMYAVWAMGPFQDGGSQPVILAHAFGNHADAVNGFRVLLNQTINMCPMLIAPTSASVTSVNSPTILSGTDFRASVISDNGYYPNPPGWGVSWNLNGYPTPIIRAMRGVELTFRISATSDHPFYITSSIIGGHSSSSETIYAGDANSWGNDTNPYVLKWVPPFGTPDVVYYQCYVHQKLGWKIELYGMAPQMTMFSLINFLVLIAIL